MLDKIVNGLDKLIQRYTPDPFIFAVLLTLVTLGLGISVSSKPPEELINDWGNGFWGLLEFTLQMVMILLGGYVLARSRPIELLLRAIVTRIQSPMMAVVCTTLVACIASWINWGFGLVVGAIFAIEVAKHLPKCNYRLLVASAYSGFIVWHSGLSGSIPLTLNTPGVAERWVDTAVPLGRTTFSQFNITALILVVLCLLLTNFFIFRTTKDNEEAHPNLSKAPEPPAPTLNTFAEKIESTPAIPIVLFLLATFYVGHQVYSHGFSLDLNRINFIFLFLGLLFHWRVKNFLAAVREGASKVGPILIQYPFYAGIMALLTSSGLAEAISLELSSMATATSFPLLTFYSAGIVNMFVPSGGGQWVVQAPVVLPGIASLGADFTKTIMAVAWGDAWTNLAQPFWALPLLAIAGMKIRDILGFCLINLFVTGTVLSILFLVY